MNSTGLSIESEAIRSDAAVALGNANARVFEAAFAFAQRAAAW